MKRKLLTLTLLAGALAGPSAALLAAAPAPTRAPQSAVVAAPDPAVQIQQWTRLFRQDDVAGLVRAVVPASRWEEFRLLYELKQLEPISAEERAEFAEKVAHFTAPNAVDVLMLEIEPELEKARPQLPGALLMGFGALHIAITSPDSKLSEEQKQSLQQALPSLQAWANGTDFLSSDTLRQALTLLTDAARRTGITDLEQFKTLPLDAALERARPLLAAAKDVVRLYGIDLDAIADSLRVEVLERSDERARVRLTVTVFDTPISTEHDLVLFEGRWYGKHAARHWQTHVELAQLQD